MEVVIENVEQKSKNALKKQAQKAKKAAELELQQRIEASKAKENEKREKRIELEKAAQQKRQQIASSRLIAPPRKDPQGNVLPALSKKEMNKQKHDMMTKGLEKMLGELGITDKNVAGKIKNLVKSGTLKNGQDVMDYVTQLVTSAQSNVEVAPGSFGDQMKTLKNAQNSARSNPVEQGPEGPLEDEGEEVVVNQQVQGGDARPMLEDIEV